MSSRKLSNKIYISKSRISKAGRGIFAYIQIRKDNLIESCPVIEIKRQDVSLIKQTELKNYYFLWHKQKKIATKVVICLGFGSIYNHSFKPNATYKKRIKEKRIDFVALKDINKGEEITVNYNYGNPDDKSTLWIKNIKPAKS